MIKNLLTTAFVVGALSACGGGGSSGPVESSSTGVLLDSPVSGITYKTTTQSGVTNSKGEFTFIPGEIINFSVGRINFPPVAAGPVVTPVELANTTDINSRVVGNLLVLLQSLDEDGDPENGISISNGSAQKATTPIDFDQAETEFATQPNLLALLASGGSSKLPVSPVLAREHFQRSLVKYLGAAPLDLTPEANVELITQRTTVCGIDVGSKSISGRVSSVHDGDTITVISNGTTYKVRLDTIDAPELAQNYGKESQAALSNIVLNKTVLVNYTKIDKYGRVVGTVFTESCLNANLTQVSTGMAWFYKAYQCEVNFSMRGQYAHAQSSASGAHLGLWSQANPTAPWIFRNGTDPGTPSCSSDSAVIAKAPVVETTPTTPLTSAAPTTTDCRKVWVNGYRRSNGTFVNGYWRNSPGCA